MKIDFKHAKGYHCESIVTRNLLVHHGLDITEPLVFGIGSGLFFAHIPFYKLYGLPMTTFRNLPGSIFRRSVKLLGVKVKLRRRFRDQQAAMDALDRALDSGVPVGLQVGVYDLPFTPWASQQRFNAHQLIVYGKENGEYLISDPSLNEPVRCSAAVLAKARFAAGTLAPHGRMFTIASTPPKVDMPRAIRKGIRTTCLYMLRIPVPFVGINGIRYLARRLNKWEKQLGEEKARIYLAQLVRLQEEIGSGGAGFRYIYAHFLEQAADLVDSPKLRECSRMMIRIADRWRDFALTASRICKGRSGPEETFAFLADLLCDCAGREKEFFTALGKTAPA